MFILGAKIFTAGYWQHGEGTWISGFQAGQEILPGEERPGLHDPQEVWVRACTQGRVWGHVEACSWGAGVQEGQTGGQVVQPPDRVRGGVEEPGGGGEDSSGDGQL